MVKTPLVKKLTTKIIDWVKTHRVEAFLLATILLIGAFLRLYKIDEYMTFLGDEGRDVLVVRRLLVNFDPILVGPGTSIGNMYLGPLYYYLMAPFLFLANYSPVGPAVMVALMGIITIWFVWFVCREWFSTSIFKGTTLQGVHSINWGALIAAGLYAIAPVVITYSRSSWNPNIMPFFSLLCIYSIWRLWQFNDLKWLVVLGVSFAFALQSHYLGLLLAPTLGVFWFIALVKNFRHSGTNHQLLKHKFIKYSLLGVFLFGLLMSPLIIFDARHGWRNFSSMQKFFTERQTTVSIRPWTSLPKIWPLITQVDTRLLAGTNTLYGVWSSAIILIGVAAVISRRLRNFKSRFTSAYPLLFTWLGVALIGLGIYKQEIYDHYYGFFFTAPFLLIGGLSQNLINFVGKKNPRIKFTTYILLLASVVLLLISNLADNPLKYAPNRQLQRSVAVSDKIIDESQSREFNIAVVAERNYEGAYQYFLEASGSQIIIIDPQKADETITDQLFVICELPSEKCDPTHNPKAEIANFGWTKVDAVWQVAGVTLYKLIHSL